MLCKHRSKLVNLRATTRIIVIAQNDPVSDTISTCYTSIGTRPSACVRAVGGNRSVISFEESGIASASERK
jgi:hypothetical protein